MFHAAILIVSAGFSWNLMFTGSTLLVGCPLLARSPSEASALVVFAFFVGFAGFSSSSDEADAALRFDVAFLVGLDATFVTSSSSDVSASTCGLLCLLAARLGGMLDGQKDLAIVMFGFVSSLLGIRHAYGRR